MSAFYDLASVVLVPSGYKSGKIYAQKPLTTDGQLTFTRASTATRVNASGLIETVASGVPRLDYLGSSCPKILLEPQRSNLALWSEQFNNAYWTQNATVTANSTISPSGAQDADTFTDASNSFLDVRRNFTITASTAYTFSIFVKKTTGALTNYAGAGFSAGGGVGIGYAIFNTTTGVINLADVAGDIVLSAKSTSYGDYYRFEMTFTTGQTSLLVLIYPALSQNGTTLSSNAQGSNVFWGAQLEVGAYGTSYVKTEAAAVTRLADAASKTGISSLIGQTEGTIFLQTYYTLPSGAGSASARFQLSDGSTSEWMIVSYPDAGSSAPRFYINNGGTDINVSSSANLVQGVNKIAAAYKNGDFVLYLNGVQVGSSTATIGVPSTSRIDLQGNAPTDATVVQGAISQALLFKTRLTNAQLAELTTL